ncbi:hypothetical protein WR25_08070 [Diploscapter pachys]|uniref:Uncharacterized protein n=1 Tax=Diploscapter pachys TaxID=2018661 RepID=A0A2A2J591_9BILA|nr:hypothetical protein WR25_08070 [Diploscapter pachys]
MNELDEALKTHPYNKNRQGEKPILPCKRIFINAFNYEVIDQFLERVSVSLDNLCIGLCNGMRGCCDVEKEFFDKPQVIGCKKLYMYTGGPIDETQLLGLEHENMIMTNNSITEALLNAYIKVELTSELAAKDFGQISIESSKDCVSGISTNFADGII